MTYDPDRVLEQLARRIADLRRQRGLSQADFASELRSTPQWVSQLERGTRSPTVHTLVKIANALRITLGELMDPEIVGHPRAANPVDAERTERTRAGGRKRLAPKKTESSMTIEPSRKRLPPKRRRR